MNTEQLGRYRGIAKRAGYSLREGDMAGKAVLELLDANAALTAERDAIAAELATVRTQANVAWQQEHTERVRLEERLKAAEQRAQALELELDCID